MRDFDPDEVVSAAMTLAGYATQRTITFLSLAESLLAPKTTPAQPRIDEPEYYTFKDAAVKLGVGVTTLKNLRKLGKIVETETDAGPRITRSEIERYIKQQE